MGLKTVLESLEGVDDAFKPLYKQGEGGKFVLDVEDYDSHPSVRALSGALTAHKATVAELREKLQTAESKVAELPEDFDPAKWLEWKAAAEKNKDGKDREVANLQQMYDDRVKAIKAEYDAKIAGLEGQISSRDDLIDKNSRDVELNSALVGANTKKEFLEAAKLLVAQRIKTVRLDDGTRVNVVPTNLGDLPLADFVKGWAETDGKAFIAPATGPDTKGGLNKNGQPDKNPWAKDSFNLTEQGKILREDSEKAKRMKAEAGIRA